MVQATRPKEVSDSAVVLWRDSYRAQGWALFFAALWMILYIGGQFPLMLIVIGLVITMAIVAAIIIKLKPRQIGAWLEPEAITTRRLFAPPKRWELDEPAKIFETDDTQRYLVTFKPQRRRLRQMICWRDEQTQKALKDAGFIITPLEPN